MKYGLGILLWILAGLSGAAVNADRYVQLIDYIGVDYRAAVDGGKIISAAEYDEMREFAATVVAQSRQLQAEHPRSQLLNQAQNLQQLIRDRAAPEHVAQASAHLRQSTLQLLNITVVPRSAPDLQRAATLYMENCATCHGADGQARTEAAQTLEPAPTDFTEVARYRERTLHGLYSTISLGVEGTAMQAYAGQLNERDRWALAFYVGQLAVTDAARSTGQSLWHNRTTDLPLADPATLTTLTPAQVEQQFGADDLAVMAYLRSNPAVLFSDAAPLAYARATILESLHSYQAGQQARAYQQALSAYLDGFELIEHSIDNVDHALREEVEVAMTTYREQIKAAAAMPPVQQQAQSIVSLLDRAAQVLHSNTLSSSAAFSGSLIILLREGLEALLVIAALAAFLIKTGRRDGLRYLHIGWITALLFGAATWFASQYLVDISGASREITEGVAALLAMLVLFYVGFWLHSKTHAAQWKKFIEDSIHKALNSGTLWAIAGLSFIAVYREVFETILFYQAMWVQAEHNAQISLLAGMAAGAGILALLAWLILRYSIRLPLRQFFSFTSVFMFALAIVFAGKGVAALQEAGKLPLDPVNFPRIDLLGIYPNLEGLLLQAGLLILALLIMFGLHRKRTAANSM